MGNELQDILLGGEGTDRIAARGGPDIAGGGPGDDFVLLGNGDDAGNGGTGPDRVRGKRGSDRIADDNGEDVNDGGRGRDRLSADFRSGAGRDELIGGTGRDELRYLCEGCDISLNGSADDGQPKGDNVRGVEDVTVSSSRYDVIGELLERFGRGDDVIVGNGADNVLSGERGPDKIIGGGGRDKLRAGIGSDRVLAADGERDEVDCGPGRRDRAVVDRRDSAAGCESVKRRRPR